MPRLSMPGLSIPGLSIPGLSILSLPIRTSRIERLLSLGSHLAALFALTLTNLRPTMLCVLFLLIGMSFIRACTQGRKGSAKYLQRIDINRENSVLVYSSRCEILTLPRVCFYSEWIIVLQFDPVLHGHEERVKKRQRRTIVRLMPDSLDAESDRRLRYYLRFECPTLSGSVSVRQ